MDNTLENKLRFFATYYPNKVSYETVANEFDVAVHGKKINETFFVNTAFYSIAEQENLVNAFIFLKPMSSNFLNPIAKELQQRTDKIQFEKDVEGEVFLADFLRSKGFALSWMGLSVEKLVEYGWVRLKTTE